MRLLFPFHCHHFKSFHFLPFHVGPGRMSSAGLDPVSPADPYQERLHASLHSILHEEGHHARSCSAFTVRRRAIQGKVILLPFVFFSKTTTHS